MIMPMKSGPSPGQRAEELVARIFEDDGWKVEREPAAESHRVDLLVRKGNKRFLVEVKALSEGRPDRVIPLLSQAILQAQACARAQEKARPLAVVSVGDAPPSLLKQVREFARDYAPQVAVGVVSESGIRSFLGEGLEGLNVERPIFRQRPAQFGRSSRNLFSDLNQWMLKVLLAPEIPERLLASPRAKIYSVSELAGAAGVSMMSASRFVQQLREEGFLDESSARIHLVRRADLFDRWRSAALRPSPEMRMRFLIRGAAHEQLRGIVSRHEACLALFAAAAALQLGHVIGVPPYVYVPRLPDLAGQAWKELAHASAGEPPDLILREAPARQSVFRGAVDQEGVAVCDVLQVWLDVSAHPSRGKEQAELIRRKIVGRIIEGMA